MSQFQALLRKRTELIDNIKRLNKLLVENRGTVWVSSSHMYGIDINSTIKAIEKDRRLIILCLLQCWTTSPWESYDHTERVGNLYRRCSCKCFEPKLFESTLSNVFYCFNRTNTEEFLSLTIQLNMELLRTGTIWNSFGDMFLMSLRCHLRSIPSF